MNIFNFNLSKFVLFCFLSIIAFALPDNSSAMTISPVIFDYTLDPGASVMGTIHVINDSEKKQTYHVAKQNFVAVGEEGKQEFLTEENSTGLATWINVEQKSITLEPGQSSDFKWLVKLPEDAEPGGHYASVFFSNAPLTEEGSTVGVGARTGVLFLVNVNGDVKESLNIESFNTYSLKGASSFFTRLPVGYELRVKNEGSVHLKPQGTIVIRNLLGNVVGSVPINPNESRVLPSSIRKILSSWGDIKLLGSEGFFSELKAEWKGFALGKYTAKAELMYGRTKHTATTEISFWVFPWRLLLVGFGILVILVLALKGYNRMVVKSAIKKTSGK